MPIDLTVLLVILFSIFLGTFANAAPFENLFLTREERARLEGGENLDPEVINQRAHWVGKALRSIYLRTLVPTMNSLGRFEMVPLFKQISEVSTGTHVLMRSGLGYLYEQMYLSAQRDASFDPETFLKKVASDDRALSSLEVLGIGSDIDILLDQTKTGEGGRNVKSVMSEIESLINRSAMNAGVGGDYGNSRRMVFILGDVKDFRDQMTRSFNQGGSITDMLAVDLNTGEVKGPPGDPGIFEKILLGEALFLPPKEGTVSDPSVQLVRLGRALTELPWLDLKDTSYFNTAITSASQMSEKAKIQFERFLRNGRLGLGGNRLHKRGLKRNTVDQDLGNWLNKNKPNEMPEYLERYPIIGDYKPLPPGLLLPNDQFRKMLGAGRFLAHATPSVEGTLGILRGGFFVSNLNQGNGIRGHGAYTSVDSKTLSQYSSGSGLIVTLDVTDSPHVRAIKYQWFHSSEGAEFVKKVKKEAAQQGIEFNQVLAKDYGVSFLVDGDIVVAINANGFETPKSYSTIVDAVVELLVRSPKMVDIKFLHSVMKLSRDIEGGQLKDVRPRVYAELSKKGWGISELAIYMSVLSLYPDNPSEVIVELFDKMLKWTTAASIKENISMAYGFDSKLQSFMDVFAILKSDGLTPDRVSVLNKKEWSVAWLQFVNMATDLLYKNGQSAEPLKEKLIYALSIIQAQGERNLLNGIKSTLEQGRFEDPVRREQVLSYVELVSKLYVLFPKDPRIRSAFENIGAEVRNAKESYGIFPAAKALYYSALARVRPEEKTNVETLIHLAADRGVDKGGLYREHVRYSLKFLLADERYRDRVIEALISMSDIDYNVWEVVIPKLSLDEILRISQKDKNALTTLLTEPALMSLPSFDGTNWSSIMEIGIQSGIGLRIMFDVVKNSNMITEVERESLIKRIFRETPTLNVFDLMQWVPEFKEDFFSIDDPQEVKRITETWSRLLIGDSNPGMKPGTFSFLMAPVVIQPFLSQMFDNPKMYRDFIYGVFNYVRSADPSDSDTYQRLMRILILHMNDESKSLDSKRLLANMIKPLIEQRMDDSAEAFKKSIEPLRLGVSKESEANKVNSGASAGACHGKAPPIFH